MRWLVLGLLLALAAAGAVLSPRLLGGNQAAVVEGQIYRSAQLDVGELEDLARRKGLRAVVNLRGERGRESWYEAEVALARRLGLALYDVRLSSKRMPSRQRLRELVAAIFEAPRPLLIHCAAGTDRTGLASALAVLANGGGLDAARREFDLAHGYLEVFSPSELPRVLDRYQGWLEQHGEPPSPDALRRFAAGGYVPGFYDAKLELLSLPPAPLADQPWELRLRVANRSPEAWPLRSGGDTGVHLALRLRSLDPASPFQLESRGRTPDRSVAPGGSLELQASMPVLPRAGRYEVWLDLVDESVAFFSDMGSEPLVVEVAARAPEAERP